MLHSSSEVRQKLEFFEYQCSMLAPRNYELSTVGLISVRCIQQQQFITKKSEGQQRSEEIKGKNSGTQRGIREKEQEKRRKRIGKKQKVKKER